MKIDVSRAPFEEVAPLRELYRQGMNCQIVHDSLHRRGFSHVFLIRVDGRIAGYGCVLGFGDDPKDVVREFYVLPVYRGAALAMFQALVAASGARTVEAQTNDVLLSLMLFDCATGIESETILFHDAFTSSLSCPGVVFRKVEDADQDRIFPHKVEGVGEYLLEAGAAIVATGGITFHYNPPYGDLYMEVDEPCRRRGYGGYLIQELKRICYEGGKLPAARCSVANPASRATLQKAGLLPCACIIKGSLLVHSENVPLSD